jgi:hypothetical protein
VAAIVADGGEDHVCSVALATLEMAAADVAIALNMSDDGFRLRGDVALRLGNAKTPELPSNRIFSAWWPKDGTPDFLLACRPAKC